MEYFEPISTADLTQELGVAEDAVTTEVNRYATTHGLEATFDDVREGIPYERLTGQAAEAIRTALATPDSDES